MVLAFEKKNRTRRNLVIIACLVIAIAFCLLIFMPVVHADIFDTGGTNTEDFYGYFIKAGISDMLVMSEMLGDIFNAAVADIYAFFQIVGGTLIGLYVIVELLRELAKGHYNLDMWLKAGITLVIGLGLVVFLTPLVGYIEKLGEALAFYVSDAFSASMAEFFESSSTAAATAVTALESIVLSCMIIYIKVMRYALLLEIVIRKAFLPLAVASIVIQGSRSPGMRFFKRFAAAYLRLALIVACVCLAAYLCTSPAVLMQGAIAIIAVFLGGIVLLTKLTGLTGEVLGLS